VNVTTGAYCVDEVLSWWTTLDTDDLPLANISTEYLCTPCMVEMLAQSQRTAYSNYNSEFIEDWQDVQASKLKIPIAALTEHCNN
jgi:hypothetical protein